MKKGIVIDRIVKPLSNQIESSYVEIGERLRRQKALESKQLLNLTLQA